MIVVLVSCVLSNLTSHEHTFSLLTFSGIFFWDLQVARLQLLYIKLLAIRRYKMLLRVIKSRQTFSFLINIKNNLQKNVKLIKTFIEERGRWGKGVWDLVGQGLKMDGTVSQRCISKYNIKVRICISAIQ